MRDRRSMNAQTIMVQRDERKASIEQRAANILSHADRKPRIRSLRWSAVH
jgi:hypothetical protein